MSLNLAIVGTGIFATDKHLPAIANIRSSLLLPVTTEPNLRLKPLLGEGGDQTGKCIEILWKGFRIEAG